MFSGRGFGLLTAICSVTVAVTACESARVIDAPSTTTTSPSRIAVGETITYSSIGATADVDCADGKRLNVLGSNNTLTVTGTCAVVSVEGPDNRITVDRIANELIVIGFHNTITYLDGEPVISDSGDANTINRS